MCELCDLKAKADKKREQYSFRIMQMQMDIQDGRPKRCSRSETRSGTRISSAAAGAVNSINRSHAPLFVQKG